MSCCAVGCQNRLSYNKKLKFYRIPSARTAFNANRRRLWLAAIKRVDWSEEKIKNARLCSAHFISGEASLDYDSPDFAPSVFYHTTQREINKGYVKLERFKRKRKRDENTRRPPGLQPSKEVTNEVAAGSSGACLSTDACRIEPEYSVTIKEIYSQGDIHHLEHDYCWVPEPTLADNALDPAKDLHEEVERLRRQVEEMSVSQRFCLGRFAASDDDIRFYTRFTTCSHLMAFWKLIEPASNNMIRVSRVRASTVKREDGTTDVALDRSLQPIDEFFLFMVHLSVGLTLRDLGHRFNIHESTVSRIITTWAHFLYTVLGSLRIWMSAEAVKAHLPNQFQDYPDTQVLIHCTELHCQTPLLKSEDFSYKSHRSFKGLIGMAPHGAVTFVSSLYAASLSDEELFKQSGIVSLLKPEMAIMFDNTLFVDDCVPCKVYRPAHLLEEQISADEGKETQLRVHIEGLIHRIKQHKLLDTVIPLSVTGTVNQIYTVACLLVNYQNGPLVEGWAED
ncbi:uncharacterized protein LOC130213768 isoform X2 [Danio aesculapii]|uniref:uncharacterized protein LOC130213768 isoform X2 n=1 Tax=Danio aesculapii TaxID=1142201 RepID=UPI0024BFDB49|nr:uncharacterized protein LOC130213768 isoform X2 [Danio aesculapii]